MFASRELSWTDPKSKLTWDVAHLFYSNDRTDYPKDKSKALNEVNYAGFNDWRLPTIEELNTLAKSEPVDNILNLKDEVAASYEKESCFWSFEKPSWSNWDECYLFNFSTLSRECQKFREQKKYKSSRGDGYTKSAKTILVRGT